MALINYERTFSYLADEIYETAAAKGFWDIDGISDDRQMYPLKLALIHSEVSEALEVHRLSYDDGPEDPVTGFTEMQEDDFLEELADVVIRVLDVVGAMDAGDTFGEIVLAKMQKNADRPYRHGKKY